MAVNVILLAALSLTAVFLWSNLENRIERIERRLKLPDCHIDLRHEPIMVCPE
jgi:hypothetical protein